MIKDSKNVLTYNLGDLSKCEFLTYAQNAFVICVKSSDNKIDVVETKTFKLKKKLDADQAKCVQATERYLFVGCWTGQVVVFDLKDDYNVVKYLKCKS